MAQPTDLSNLDVDEVSVVKRGAIRRVFSLFKSDDDGTVELEKATVDALATPLENEADVVDALKKDGLDGAELEAAVAAARLDAFAKAKKPNPDENAENAADLNDNDEGSANDNDDAPDADEMKKDDAAPVAKSADDLGGSGNATKEYGMGDSPANAPVMKEDGTWDTSGVVDPATRSFYDTVLKSLDDAKAEGNALRDSVKKAEERASDLEDKLIEKELVAKAEGEFSRIAKADELVPVLKAAKDGLDAETFEKLSELLKTADAKIEAGALFAELGRSADPVIKDAIARGAHVPSGGGDAWDQIVEKAEAMVLKDGEELSSEQKIDRYLKTAEGKRAYADYRAENGAMT